MRLERPRRLRRRQEPCFSLAPGISGCRTARWWICCWSSAFLRLVAAAAAGHVDNKVITRELSQFEGAKVHLCAYQWDQGCAYVFLNFFYLFVLLL